MDILWFLIIGVVAGCLAGRFVQGGGFGLVGDLVVGIVGAILGGWIFGVMGISSSGLIGSLVTATVGAVVFLWLLRMFKKP